MRHYIKILDFTEEYARKVRTLPADWAKSVFDDITENGSALTGEPLPGSASGPRIGLSGDVFYCEAGADTRRPDTLFVARIESADRRKLRSIPKKVLGQFLLLGGSRFPGETLDPVAYLLQRDGVSVEAVRVRENPSVPLQRALAEAPAALARAWQPRGRALGEPSVTSLDAIRAPWSRFGLTRFGRVSPRQSNILNRRLDPGPNPSEEVAELAFVFDVALLNAVVARDKAVLAPLLAEIAALPLAPDVCAVVWCGILAGRPALEVRRALHEAAPDLEALADSATTSQAWAQTLIAMMTAVAEAEGDRSLVDRAQLAREASDPLRSIASWAAQLQFQSREPVPGPDDERRQALEDAPRGAGDRNSDSPSRGSSALNQWVLRLGLPDGDLAKSVETELTARLVATRGLTSGAASIDGLKRLLGELRSLSSQLEAWLPRLPDPKVLEALHEDALLAHEAARTLLGAAADDLIARTPTPAEVQEIVRLVGRIDALAHFPDWLAPEPAFRTPRDWALWLCDAERRGRVSALMGVADEGRLRDLSLLRDVPPPVGATDFEHHVRAALKSVFDLEDELAGLSPVHRAWIDARIASGEDRTQLLVSAHNLDDLRGRVGEPTFAAILESATATPSPAERTHRIDAYKSALRFFEQSLGSGMDATIAQLDARIARQGAIGGTPSTASTTVHWDLSVEQSFFDTPPARAPLSFQPIEGQPYGRVLVPLAIEASHPGDFSLRLDIHVPSKGHQHWPSNWRGITPESVVIGRQSWNEVALNRYRYVLPLDVPIRAPDAAGEPLELAVTLRDSVRDVAVSKTHALRWGNIEPTFRPVKLVWPEAITKSYVETQPIGPQKKVQQIVARVEMGRSFAVVAPRRFGKSTLVEYLVSRLNDQGYVVPAAVVCTEYYDSTGMQMEELWRDVSERLAKRLEAGLVDSSLNDGVPTPEAFDYVRRAARRSGKRGIVLLFDESQVLFSRAGGPYRGNRLKDRLERSWSTTGSDDLAPVLMGFVGLPSLLDRVGDNFNGLLDPIVAKEIEEEDLNRLLLKVTNGQLATTREARQTLIDGTRNLHLLRNLVEDLVLSLNEQGRRWATHDDVAAVSFALHSALRNGDGLNVAKSLRDSFNEAEILDDWRPSREFPAALALAMARHQGARRDEEIVARTRKYLNDWCGEIKIASAANLSFGDSRIDELLARLREAGILNPSHLSFRSDLLEAWLVGQAREGYPRVAQDALIKAANVTIRTPEGAEPMNEGGEARVFRFTENGVAKAIRRVQLCDEKAKQRFLETCASISVLADGEHKNEPGAQYIVDLEAIGFAAESSMEAVQIYRWIDGADLGEKVGALDAPLVSDIGYRLALALQLLHTKRIVHRDVRPQNVILSHAEKRPVLIDFGMARLETSPMVTALPSEFSAPEVRGLSPRWSRAADVYGLGRTLLALLAHPRDVPDELRALLDDCTADDPGHRPEAKEVAERLRQTRETLHVYEQRRALWDKVQSIAGADRELQWFDDVLSKFRPRFEALRLGLYREEFERSAEFADFLNQVLEARPVRGGAERLKLGNIKIPNPVTGDRLVGNRSIEFLHLARNWVNHGSSRASVRERILVQMGRPDAQQMRRLVADGAAEIEKILGLKSLSQVIAAAYGT